MATVVTAMAAGAAQAAAAVGTTARVGHTGHLRVANVVSLLGATITGVDVVGGHLRVVNVNVVNVLNLKEKDEKNCLGAVANGRLRLGKVRSTCGMMMARWAESHMVLV